MPDQTSQPLHQKAAAITVSRDIMGLGAATSAERWPATFEEQIMVRFRMFSIGLVLVAGIAALADPAPAARKVPRELLEKRLESARKVFEQNMVRLKAREGLPAELFGWSERWLAAELALADRPANRVKALRDHLDRTREVERAAVNFARTGQGRQADADAATYYRLEAEIRLLKEGVEPQGVKSDKEKPDKK